MEQGNNHLSPWYSEHVPQGGSPREDPKEAGSFSCPGNTLNFLGIAGKSSLGEESLGYSD